MKNISETYDKHYKKLLIIPAIILLFSLSYMVFFYSQNGDILSKDVSLTGGTSITLFTQLSSSQISESLSSEFKGISVSTISDNLGRQVGVIILVPEEEPAKIKSLIQERIGIELDDENSNIEFTGTALGSGFYSQLAKALIFAFLLMAMVVFFVFGENKRFKIYSIILTSTAARLTFPINKLIGIFAFVFALSAVLYGLFYLSNKKDSLYLVLLLISFTVLFFFPIYLFIVPISIGLFIIYIFVSIPSVAIILSAFADILAALAVVNLMGVKISSAGIIAFLMLIGYSVDTNILLTSRVLKRKNDSINRAIWDAFKTGTMMTTTSLVAIGVALIFVYRFESILNQIFLIIMLGLSFDLINTWIANGGIIKWYMERKK